MIDVKDPTVPAVSPTGTPLIPPVVVAWVTLVFSVAAPILVGLVQLFPQERVFLVVLLVLQCLGSGFGLASPGLRRQQKKE
jgi:hypothetical protein